MGKLRQGEVLEFLYTNRTIGQFQKLINCCSKSQTNVGKESLVLYTTRHPWYLFGVETEVISHLRNPPNFILHQQHKFKAVKGSTNLVIAYTRARNYNALACRKSMKNVDIMVL
uniref:Uncharacterized protein n=1 Tax=Arundo donax TaxID=35708 RepID=A0A0A9GP18_ARUDO